MECVRWRDDINAWMKAHWDNPQREIPAQLREHAAECSDCGNRLTALMRLADGSALKREPLPGLSGRLEAGFRERRTEGGHTAAWLRRAALPLAAMLLFAATFSLLQGVLHTPQNDTVIVRLELEAPRAGEVSVVGDWNGWDPVKDRLEDPDGDGVWEIELRLHRGRELQYQFLIDNERWVADPATPLKVDDGFGGVNSILQI